MLKHSHNNDDPRVICESLSKYHYHRTAHHRSRLLSLTEIALAGARKVKLKILAEAGEERAQKVLDLQEQSADFFAASQIGLNAVAILGGILGEAAFRPFL